MADDKPGTKGTKRNERISGRITGRGFIPDPPEKKKKKSAADGVKWKINKGDSPVRESDYRKKLEGKRI
jgi:hypothetical protein